MDGLMEKNMLRKANNKDKVVKCMNDEICVKSLKTKQSKGGK